MTDNSPTACLLIHSTFALEMERWIRSRKEGEGKGGEGEGIRVLTGKEDVDVWDLLILLVQQQQHSLTGRNEKEK